MARPTPVHYLRANETEWSPLNLIFFDTESRFELTGTSELHTLRLWCATAVRRDRAPDHQRAGHRAHGFDAASLAAYVHTQTTGCNTSWAYAHNLTFDLAVTRLLDHLARLGWVLTVFGVTDRHPFFRLKRGSRRLTLADSWSWLPESLERVGELAGVRKPPLPEWEADDAAWLTRCYGDVDTMAAAVLQLMEFWDKGRFGRWALTGASTGWNAMRHMSTAKVLLVDPDDAARKWERKAIRGGRRDVWRVGELAGGPFCHLDAVRAHATIAEHLPLPFRREGHFTTMPLDSAQWDRPLVTMAAEALVTATAPRWPCRLGARTFWPVGRFWTHLAGPELCRARELGDLVQVGAGYVYRTGNHLAAWGRWVNRLAAGEDADAPEVARLAAKHWGRAVLGKFAGHTSDAQHRGVALNPDWHAEAGWTLARGTRATVIDVMGERWWIDHEQEADDAFPGVLAWVESHLRVRMAAIIDLLGPRIVVTCDTDGVLVDLGAAVLDRAVFPGRRPARGSPVRVAQMICDYLAPLTAPLEFQPRTVYERVTVTGPQQLTLAGRRLMAGVPRSATAQPDGTFRARTWPHLRWQMRHGDPRGYVRPELVYRPKGRYVRRWVLPTGRAQPVEVRDAGYMVNEIVPPQEMTPPLEAGWGDVTQLPALLEVTR